MDHYYYIIEDIFYIGAKCPNCGCSFNMMDDGCDYLDLPANESEKVHILYCGKCKVDLGKVRELIRSGQVELKEMKTGDLNEIV